MFPAIAVDPPEGQLDTWRGPPRTQVQCWTLTMYLPLPKSAARGLDATTQTRSRSRMPLKNDHVPTRRNTPWFGHPHGPVKKHQEKRWLVEEHRPDIGRCTPSGSMSFPGCIPRV